MDEIRRSTLNSKPLARRVHVYMFIDKQGNMLRVQASHWTRRRNNPVFSTHCI
jgi:hypothetical protein